MRLVFFRRLLGISIIGFGKIQPSWLVNIKEWQLEKCSDFALMTEVQEWWKTCGKSLQFGKKRLTGGRNFGIMQLQ